MNLGAIGTSVQKFVRFAVVGLMALTVAACGGGGGSPGTVSGSSGSTATTPASISLLFSSTTLPSSGVAGTEVTVTALVKNSNNNSIASVPVTFTADSGALTSVSASTDASGKATALLSTSGDKANRKITLTARAGNITATGTVDVTGTKVDINGPSTVTLGQASDFGITVTDHAGKAIAGAPVTISSSSGNGVVVKSSGGGSSSVPLTDSNGRVVVAVTGNRGGDDTLIASAQGASSSTKFTVNTASVSVTAAVSEANVETCTSIEARYQNAGVSQNGTINISTTRGVIYADSACNTAFGATGVSIAPGGTLITYIKSSTAGTAVITATIANGPTAQDDIKFVAPLTTTATISIQPEPSIVSPSGTSQSNTSVLKAIVRDGTSRNNLVKGAVVEFTIVSDQSGGSLSNPSVVTTGDDGSASVTFAAGPATTATNGVIIQARILSPILTSPKTATTNLTVARKSLFISAGTGNQLAEPSSSTYRQDYTVFVTDSGGNPVPEVTVTASLKATHYRKGEYKFDSDPATTDTGWTIIPKDDPNYICPNEDQNNDGILDIGEDDNESGTLEPRLPFTVTSSGKTDTSGIAQISILYPQDRGNWTYVQLTVTGSVAGTEGSYSTSIYALPVLASDLSDQSTAPPGSSSPYGVNPCSLRN